MNKKVWNNPTVAQLNVAKTEYGGDNPKNIDGPYIEVGDQKYWPSAS